MVNPILTIKSHKEFEKVTQDLQDAVQHHKFGVMATHDLKQTMANKGGEFSRECRIFEVCNPHQAKIVLESNMEISAALPCRISVYREGGETVMVTFRPTAMMGMFAAEGLADVAQEVEDTIAAIMKEAAE